MCLALLQAYTVPPRGPKPLALRSDVMTLCPIAIVAGCQKCPAFKVCPLKTVLGDQPSKPPAGGSSSGGGKK
jgi:hypothetical protein